jgi:hypothetical protein
VTVGKLGTTIASRVPCAEPGMVDKASIIAKRIKNPMSIFFFMIFPFFLKNQKPFVPYSIIPK